MYHYYCIIVLSAPLLYFGAFILNLWIFFLPFGRKKKAALVYSADIVYFWMIDVWIKHREATVSLCFLWLIRLAFALESSRHRGPSPVCITSIFCTPLLLHCFCLPAVWSLPFFCTCVVYFQVHIRNWALQWSRGAAGDPRQVCFFCCF